jgi:hypothetical protein
MIELRDQIGALDSDLFSYVDAQTGEWDRRALLALHAAAADAVGSFAYLEIGSYLGGSLQALIRDPRCRAVISLDPRTVETPDDRGDEWVYKNNTTEHMVELLRGVPGADMAKLTTFEAGTDDMSSADLPLRPDYCLIDGEHTNDAVMRDARFCAEALNGTGVIAFHDYVIVGSAISTFLRDNWREITFALAFSGPSHPSYGGGVFAVELGGGGLLRHPAVTRAIGSRWHATVWKAVNRPRRTATPLLVAWATMPAIDGFVVQARHGFREYLGLG